MSEKVASVRNSGYSDERHAVWLEQILSGHGTES
jgi:hypothetical protein